MTQEVFGQAGLLPVNLPKNYRLRAKPAVQKRRRKRREKSGESGAGGSEKPLPFIEPPRGGRSLPSHPACFPKH
jgi:hypothetical protein